MSFLHSAVAQIPKSREASWYCRFVLHGRRNGLSSMHEAILSQSSHVSLASRCLVDQEDQDFSSLTSIQNQGFYRNLFQLLEVSTLRYFSIICILDYGGLLMLLCSQ